MGTTWYSDFTTLMLRTKRQRTVLCRSCPVAKTADLVGDSISLLILRDVLVKPRRFGDFELSLAGVSSRTISSKLRALEKRALITRVPDPAAYPRIDYRATAKGVALKAVVNAMRAYGKKYL